MDVTFTNVLEGARQYFQGLPMGTNSAASPMYPVQSDIQQRTNNEPTRSQEMHPSTSPYWLGQHDPQRLPSREPTPTQRPPSYNSDTSRPPSHSLYANTSQDQRRTPNYPANYQEQSTHFQQQQQQPHHSQQQQQHSQQQQLNTNQQQQLQHTQQQLKPQPQVSQDFQFTRPAYREAPSNSSHHYSSHILQNPAYHPPSSISTIPSHQQPASPKQQRKVEQNMVPSSSSHLTQLTTPTPTSSTYSSYPQSRSYYPSSSYANVQNPVENKNYSGSHNYPYQQPTQMSNSMYYKNIYQPQSSYTSSSTTHSANLHHEANYNQSSKTQNSPIPQLADNFSKTIRDNQKFAPTRSTANCSNVIASSSVMKQSGVREYDMEYQYQNRPTSQQYLPSTSTITTTSLSYNTVTTCRSDNSFAVNTLSPSVNQQFTSKSTQPVSFNTTITQQSSTSTPVSCSVPKQKRESPLDLSVKTVRTPADSTLDDTDADRSNYFQPNRIPQMSTANYPGYDPFTGTYQRNNVQSVPHLPSASAPKVDFAPNFNVSTMGNPSFRPTQRPVSTPFQMSTPRAHSSLIPQRGKETSSAARYPVVSVPSMANVNSYMQSQSSNKTSTKILPRIEFPSVGHGLKTSAFYPSHNSDSQKKRPADTAPSLAPKMPRVESWRQTIDQQIEQKLSSYKQVQQSPTKQISHRPAVNNGSYTAAIPDRSREMYNNYHGPQYQVGVSSQQTYNMNQYQSHPNHNQTYVPSPANHPYNNTNTTYSTQNTYIQNGLPRSSSSALNAKTTTSGAADKRVLTLLRNSIETKGVKEAQRKYELEQYNKFAEQPHHRPDIQHPSTHVTAPLQPKPSYMGRQNVSPFTPNSLPEGNNTTPIYNKLNVPRAVDSISFDSNKGIRNLGNKQLTETVINDQHNPNGDLDGLAAFLAARIRTKAELKQVSPNQQANNNGNNELHSIIENQIRTPMKPDTYSSSFTSSSHTSGSSTSKSPPKLTKEQHQQSQQTRKRLFSRTEEHLPRRDKSGMRSSSETSVFDFPDSGSDGEMPVLEMQSLNAMRRERKSSPKLHEASLHKQTVPSPRPIESDDDIFSQACDTFLDQLKAGVGKKRGKRKKGLEPDVLAQLENVTRERPISPEVTVKEEIFDDPPEYKPISIQDQSVTPTEPTAKTKADQEDIPAIPIKKEITVESNANNKDSSEAKKTQVELSDSEGETIKQLLNKLRNKSEVKVQEDNVKVKPDDILTVINSPAKKPAFGDGSAFYPGWEEEVYRYKKSLRMPPSLIQVNRPPSAMRLSTSLPDLDPCSPASLVQEKDEDSKSIFAKIKSEPIDSDIESNSSFNLFNNKNNYDSEGSASIKSLPVQVKDSIVDKLLQKCGKRKKRKYKRKEEEGPKIIPKSENPLELLPTPSLEIKVGEKISKDPVIKTESPILGFRKSTIDNFKDAFLNKANNIVGVNEQFSTVILKSRTRKETRVLKQRATIKEVFGEDRPASAPPVTCLDVEEIKKEVDENIEQNENTNEADDAKGKIKNKLLGRKKKTNNLFKSIADRNLKTEILEETTQDDKSAISISRDQSPSTISEDLDSKSETPSLDGDDSNISLKRRGKFNKIRRKFSSGFDYIRKKKKQVKKESDRNELVPKRKKGHTGLKATPESEQDIRKEIKTWVLNKGIGETHLHRSARLGYTDITAFCLEKMDCSPSPKDNAGYTPLHEACSRGHLDIARLLLMYGANVSESAKGGIRPLHEAIENGFLEIIRLLLSYGADPKLATYAGLTPLSLASEENTKELLQNHMDDLEGTSTVPWAFNGPASCFDPKENGYNVLSTPPQSEPQSEEEDIEFEVSESLLPNLYTLRGEPTSDRWVLLQDLSNILKIKSRDALLKQLCPAPPPGTSTNYKSLLRELKTSDFLEQAHCCQFLNAGEKINTRASKIALVKYSDKIRELLKIEKVVITTR